MISIQEPENLKRYAHIVDGKVVNVSIWDGESEWTPEEEIVELPDESTAGIDWDYIDGEFIDNRPTINYEVE
jgi:hypothetical protein